MKLNHGGSFPIRFGPRNSVSENSTVHIFDDHENLIENRFEIDKKLLEEGKTSDVEGNPVIF